MFAFAGVIAVRGLALDEVSDEENDTTGKKKKES